MGLRQFVPAPLRKLKRQLQGSLWIDDPSVSVGDYFIRLGIDPSDIKDLTNAAERLLEKRQARLTPGSPERGRLILQLIANSFPTSRLTDAYFQNLAMFLETRPRRPRPGQIILGIGSGRSGSTTLAALFASWEDSCATHENPPLIGWTPDEAEIAFHLRRFEMLRHHYAIVADVSHWWLNALDTVIDRFPDAKIIGLHRDADACARSFMRIKGEGRNSLNHWAPGDNGIWQPNIWDQTYPTYPVPDSAASDPDQAKSVMITQYVRDYNDLMKAWAVRNPEHIVLFETESLSDAPVTARICELAGVPAIPFERKLNVNNVHEGEADEFIL
jgi:Sulfotransferase family